MEKVKRVNLDGPPGTGKSSRLTRLFIAAAEELGPKRVGAVTFTRSAAEVLRQRAGEALNLGKVSHVLRRLLPYVGTVHSIIYQTLGHPKLVGGKELNEFCDYMNLPQVRGVPNDPDDLDGFWTPEDVGRRPGVGMMLRVLSASRHRGVEIREVVPDLVPPTLTALYRPDWFESLAEKYTAWKRDSGLLDYDDLLDAGKKLTLPVSVLLCDEVQDNSKMLWRVVDAWAVPVRVAVFAGDAFQCQPGGTKVLTTKGYVNIEDLDPEIHRVVGYDMAASEMRMRGYGFKKSSRQFFGYVYKVSAGGHLTKCTGEHKWPVQWVKGVERKGANVVYLMRRGKDFRVGWCQLFTSQGSLHLKVRANLEKADEVWILKVCWERTEASFWESYVAAEYGITTQTFQEVKGGVWGQAAHWTQEQLDRFYSLFDEHETYSRAMDALDEFGRDIRYPFIRMSEVYAKRGKRVTLVVEAPNILPELMTIGVCGESSRGATWEPVGVERSKYHGTVYSLDVDKYHLYVADGLLTHNSIYKFSGANPDLFLNHPGEWGYLTVSHRLDDASAAYSHDVLRAGGWDLGDKKPVRGGGRLRADGSTLLLARTNSLVARLEDEQAQIGEPYLLLGRYSPWTSLTADAYRVMSTLRNGGVIRASQLQAMVKAARPGALSREAVASLSRLSSGERVVTAGDVARVMSLDSYAAKNPDVWSYMERVERKHGYTSIYSRPKTLIGTVHKAKGMEADEVVLLQDWGVLPAKVASVRGDGSRSEACVAYVATTRHRGRLTVRYLGDTPPYPFPRRKDDAA